MPKIQIMYFLYVTLLTLLFCNGLKIFRKCMDPSHSVYM